MMKKYGKYILLIGTLSIALACIYIQPTFAEKSLIYGNYRYTCSNDLATDVALGDSNKCINSCFVENTLISMADGSEKNIQDVQVGDILKGSNGNNKVLKLIRKDSDSDIYSFNGGRYFVTDSHPFKTIQGWKSINPSITQKMNPELIVTQLHEGDLLITESGVVLLTTINQEYNPQTVYTFEVDGTHDYYADGYLVHNKNACADTLYDGADTLYDPNIGTVSPYLVCNFNTSSCSFDLPNTCNYVGIATEKYLGGGVTLACDTGETQVQKIKYPPSTYAPSLLQRRYNTPSPDGSNYIYQVKTGGVYVNWDLSNSQWNDLSSTGAYCRYIGCVGFYPTTGFVTYDVCETACTTTTSTPTVCSLSDPLIAGVCYQPAIGSTTLLVKDGRVAINSADVDRGSNTTSSTNTSCRTNSDCGGNTCNGYIPAGNSTAGSCAGTYNKDNYIWQLNRSEYDQSISNAEGSMGLVIENLVQVDPTPVMPATPPTSRGEKANITQVCWTGDAYDNRVWHSYQGPDSGCGNMRRESVTSSTSPASCNSLSQSACTPSGCTWNPGITSTPEQLGTCSSSAPTTTTPATLLVVGTNGVRGAQILNLSDARIKTNITKIDNALANITKLNGYQFTWKDSGKPDFGVLAQEVEKVYASMVAQDSDGIKSVDYNALLAPIIEAIHEINARVDELTVQAHQQSLRLDALEK